MLKLKGKEIITILRWTCLFIRSDPQKSEPLYDDDEEEEILGSDDDEQEDPKDYCKGTKHQN